MSKTHYELRPGVNQVRIGTIVVSAAGYTTADPDEQLLLNEHPDVTTAKGKTETTKEEGS